MAKEKVWIETLKEMNGSEVYFNESLVGIEYPYIWKNGKKIKLSLENWRKLYKQYFNSSENDGYWLMKDVEKEFGGVFKK